MGSPRRAWHRAPAWESPESASVPWDCSPASPGRSQHEDAAPPPVQNVFLGPCPGSSPGSSPGSTGGGSAGRGHLGSEDTGHCPALPAPPGLWAAWPVPALPPGPSRLQGALWPQTQPSSGRRAQGNSWPHLSPAGDTPLAPLWLGRHRSPNPPGFTGGSGAPAPLIPQKLLPRAVWGVCGFPGPLLPLTGTALPWLGSVATGSLPPRPVRAHQSPLGSPSGPPARLPAPRPEPSPGPSATYL